MVYAYFEKERRVKTVVYACNCVTYAKCAADGTSR